MNPTYFIHVWKNEDQVMASEISRNSMNELRKLYPEHYKHFLFAGKSGVVIAVVLDDDTTRSDCLTMSTYYMKGLYKHYHADLDKGIIIETQGIEKITPSY